MALAPLFSMSSYAHAALLRVWWSFYSCIADAQTCGRKVEISENTIWIELMTSSTLFKLRRGVCSVFTGGSDFAFHDAAMGG